MYTYIVKRESFDCLSLSAFIFMSTLEGFERTLPRITCAQHISVTLTEGSKQFLLGDHQISSVLSDGSHMLELVVGI